MCTGENCMPRCQRFSSVIDPYCTPKNKPLSEPRVDREVSAPVESASEVSIASCSKDTYIAVGGDSLACWFAGMLGFECKSELQRVQECVENLKSTTDREYHYDTQCQTNPDGTVCYYKVIKGRRPS